MFKHQGKSRTPKHNLQIASILSLVAGIVNIVGLVSLTQLTTNVTGHFAHFIHNLAKLEISEALLFCIYILAFLCGAIISSIFIEFEKRDKKINVFLFPILLESFTLIIVSLLNDFHIGSLNMSITLLLFAMGIQNSFVTKVSNAVVRTTHLTGLFTDLGIEISQLMFAHNRGLIHNIKSRIKLRLYIIAFFFTGGILGYYLFTIFGLNSLMFASTILLLALLFDNFIASD